ncbi:hypothetical protein CKO42_24505 [Lamprobacter modestohalophilus]|uniref:Flagellar hook-length control protein-like C-terminal domain-containing protein n=2 Tax=Lamprobacter modestohalophilus TaxID=1064514 RepID=A0A9X0WE44_9GAMM|nr:hypothetical protein [Lamprobacter modestohalophilus]MCF7993303.1 flagellar hook-length control protein FliK [Chromatiaceae bacterium]MCF8014354.1 flagellar hook-length control protein FliK [Chromatiaceae bacterium]
MSGINTLIDTLMHQVLGKRVDTPHPRDLNQPVKPMTAAGALAAVRSDSRLDARNNAPVREAGRAPQDERATQARQPTGEKLPPPSTQTTFTSSARSIADLMLRFPASPSALRVAQPLFPSSQSPAPTQVAERLQSSVRDSGLFYESHLSRWFRGELPREQLLREPQMLRSLNFSQAASSLPPAPLKTSLPAFLLGLSRVGGAAPALAQSGLNAQSVLPVAPPGAGVGGVSAAPGSAQPLGLAGAAAGADARGNSAAAQPQALNADITTRSGREQPLLDPQTLSSLRFTQASPSLPPTPLKTSLPAFLLGLSRAGEAPAGFAQGGTSGQSASPAAPGSASAAGAPGAPGTSQTAQPSAPPGAPAGVAGADARASSVAAVQQQALNAEIATQSARLQRSEVIHESLQGVVRHQLELLATPVLRWEGDVWSGIFMALMIQPPAKRDERGGTDEEQGQDESGTKEWHSNMTLQVAGLGEVGVKLWLRDSQLDLELVARDPDVRLALAEGVDQLKSRLDALDLAEVRIRLHHDLLEPEEAPP